MLNASDRHRLLRALALLRSPMQGERDAAALAALRILDAAGLDWGSVIPEPEPELPHDPRDGDGWRELAVGLLRSHAAAFNDKERDFLRNVVRFQRISEAQLNWLLRLAGRVRLATGARRGARAA